MFKPSIFPILIWIANLEFEKYKRSNLECQPKLEIQKFWILVGFLKNGQIIISLCTGRKKSRIYVSFFTNFHFIYSRIILIQFYSAVTLQKVACGQICIKRRRNRDNIQNIPMQLQEHNFTLKSCKQVGSQNGFSSKCVQKQNLNYIRRIHMKKPV